MNTWNHIVVSKQFTFLKTYLQGIRLEILNILIDK